MNPQATLNYLLGVTEGLVMYSIYSDYVNKIQGDKTWKVFDINADGYVPKSYNTIADFTGLEYDTVRRCVDRLVKRGLLQKKPGNKDTYNIPYYKPEYRSSVFIKIAEEKLVDKRNARDEKNKNQAERLIPQIIETLEKDQYVMIALGLIKEKIEGIRKWFKHMEIKKKTEETEEAKVIPIKKCAENSISWEDL